MNTPMSNVKRDEVYKRSEFTDLLTSNNFYTVSAIALVLGVVTAFGFVQNPRKLKTVVDVLSYKVSITHPDNQKMSFQAFQQERYDLSASIDSHLPVKHQQVKYSGEAYLFGGERTGAAHKKDIKRVAFSYDITSNNFWKDLDSSNIGGAKDANRRDDYKFHPLSIQEEGNALMDSSDSKYSLANDLKRNK